MEIHACSNFPGNLHSVLYILSVILRVVFVLHRKIVWNNSNNLLWYFFFENKLTSSQTEDYYEKSFIYTSLLLTFIFSKTHTPSGCHLHSILWWIIRSLILNEKFNFINSMKDLIIIKCVEIFFATVDCCSG